MALAAVLGAALAFWLSAGTLTVANVDPGAPRIALLASTAWLALVTASSLVLVFVIRPAVTRVGVLALSFFILLPWIPLPLPYAAFVWTGPLRFWLWLAIGAALTVPVVEPRVRHFIVSPPPRGARRGSPRRSRRARISPGRGRSSRVCLPATNLTTSSSRRAC